MKTTTTLLVLMILLTSYSLSAQTKIGLTGGVSFANVTAKYQGISVSPKMKAGFTGGLFAAIPLSSNFSFQPALNFVQKGFSTKDETATDKVSYNYVEVPLNFVYSSRGFFIGAGPSMAFGLSGKEKFVDKSDPSNSADTKITFGSGDDEIKRFEFGANFLTGYKTSSGFMFSVNYDVGLNNIQNGDASDVGTIKNKYFAVKIGYVFGGNKMK
jgi:Outer membrane protein beta-barrel domain